MKIFSIIIWLLFIVASLAHGQNQKTYTTTRIKNSPHIDGEFNDESWLNIKWEGNFVQFEPNSGVLPSQQTFFKIIYDDNNIYVAIKSLDSEPNKIEDRLSRRDEWEGELAGLHFDSYFDKRTSFVFAVSAGGVKNDGFFSNDGDSFDDSWDPIWYVKTKITNEGWNAEMRIPLSQLRFNNDANQIWGLQVVRSIFRKDELSFWSPMDQEQPGFVSQYGTLDGINNIKPKRNIELVPFIVTKLETYKSEDGNPFLDGRDFGFEGGLDGKIGLTNDLTLDFAINPDFGQVEADPSEVNLSAFESFFQEKRPFFVEGNNITNFQLTPGNSPYSGDNLFYSRRIGRNPRGYPDIASNEFLKRPKNTRILGSFKLTGKTKKGWSIGIIESLTNREYALIDNNGEQRKESIEPLTNYFLTRIQKDINKGNALIGGMITSTYRDIKNKNLNFLPTHAMTGGLDYTQFFKNKNYFLTTSFSGSQVNGSKEAISELQKSSRRYFQRPDADYLTFDPNKTSLRGTAAAIMGGKQTNSGFRYLFNLTWRSPGLALNDIGFMRQANTIFHFIWLSYKINKPFSIFRSVQFNTNEWRGWDFGRNTIFKGGNVNFQMQFNNLWRLGTGFNIEGRGISNTELRGGPSMYSTGNWNLWWRLSSNPKKKLNGFWGGSLNRGNFNSSANTNFWMGLTYRPISTLRFTLEPSYSLRNSILQYVTEKDLNGDPRYLFSSLDHKTFNLTLRMDYNITPNLSIQYYGSPFISSVLYDDFKYITNSKADAFNDRFHTFQPNEISLNDVMNNYSVHENGIDDDYSFSNPNFNFKQFRSNMVMRWEYTPGSTLFLVWSQGRTDFEETNESFDLKNNFKSLFKVSPNDVFLMKVSYRINANR